jgi:hypothetical protein
VVLLGGLFFYVSIQPRSGPLVTNLASRLPDCGPDLVTILIIFQVTQFAFCSTHNQFKQRKVLSILGPFPDMVIKFSIQVTSGLAAVERLIAIIFKWVSANICASQDCFEDEVVTCVLTLDTGP